MFEKFSKVRVLVIGDVMLDKYWWGNMTRISPEAPVPIVHLQKTSQAVGGAANVAANVAGLGAEVYLIGLVGADPEAAELAELLKDLKISPEYLVKTNVRPTTQKTRIVAHNQQVLRLDQEKTVNLAAVEENSLWENIAKCLSKIDIVIVSDYGKGTLSDNILARLITTCKLSNLDVLVDPKGQNFNKYSQSFILTPNQREAFEAAGVEISRPDQLEEVGNSLLTKLALKSLLMTLGEDGMALFKQNQPIRYFKARARHVFDVTGAGDTVIATLGVALGAKFELDEAAELANIAAGFVVEEFGTTIIDVEKLSNYYVR
jgi:rfaE bifunctional protein kinase chain/domain